MTHIPDAHSAHDQLLLAAFAAGDLPEAAAADAARLAASCPECAQLVGDLRAIARATAALPAPVRRRDFRLSAADAARLRGPVWRRALSAVIAPRFSFTRPLAAALTTLGLAGLLLASLPAGLTGGTTVVLSTGGAGVSDQAAPPASGAAAAGSAAAQAAGLGQAGTAAPIVGPTLDTRSQVGPVPSPAASASGATGPGATASAAANTSSLATSPGPASATAGPAGAPLPAPSASPGPEAVTVPPLVGAAPVTGSPAPQVFAAASPREPSGSAASEAGKSAASDAGHQGLEAQRAVGDSGKPNVSPLVLLSIVFLVGGIGLFGLRFAAGRLARG